MTNSSQGFEPSNFEHKQLFENPLRIFIFNILKESYISLMSDSKIKINKKNEGKCTIQLVYFARMLNDHYPFFFETESPYMKNIKNIVYGDENPKKLPRLDIKIRKRDWDEERFITVECKRLDQSATLINKYVDEGMDRFISAKYCFDNDCSFMIGFIIEGDNLAIIAKLNKYIESKYSENDILKECVRKIQYHSIHNRSQGHTPFDIYHLFANIDKLTL